MSGLPNTPQPIDEGVKNLESLSSIDECEYKRHRDQHSTNNI
jgi:hypothetical protein